MFHHSWISCALALATFAICAMAAQCRASAAETVLRADFTKPDAPSGWAGAGSLVPGRGTGTALLIESADRKGSVSRTIALPAERLAGQLLTVRVTLKAEGVTPPPKAWNGIKVMLVLETPSGKDHPQVGLSHGSFDWQTQSRVLRVPDDLKKATLVLGLEQVAGKVWFESVDLVTGRGPAKKSEKPYRGHSLERLRGVMYGPRYSEKDIRDLAEWGCNLLRWQLTWNGFPHSPADRASPEEYERWLDARLDEVDRGLALCERLGMLVLIDLHTPPGGRDEQKFCRIFSEKRFQEQFLALWERIAKRYKDRKTVWGYDLVNEPYVGKVGEGCMNWQELADATARRVRAIDPDHAIILEPIWGDPHALDNLIPIDVPNVVYSVHMYLPHAFTHQGVHESPIGPVYPGEIQGRKWDRETLRNSLKNVVEYARDYGVHIYVGEFSAIRWAPENSAYRYLKDCIEFFEEMGWDWSYHAFREWDGWSVEHTTNRDDPKPSPTRTDREQLLRDWFAKNRHPTK